MGIFNTFVQHLIYLPQIYFYALWLFDLKSDATDANCCINIWNNNFIITSEVWIGVVVIDFSTYYALSKSKLLEF